MKEQGKAINQKKNKQTMKQINKLSDKGFQNSSNNNAN